MSSSSTAAVALLLLFVANTASSAASDIEGDVGDTSAGIIDYTKMDRNPSYDDVLRTGATGLGYAIYLSDHPEAGLAEAVESVVVRRYAPKSKIPTTYTVFHRDPSSVVQKQDQDTTQHQHRTKEAGGGGLDVVLDGDAATTNVGLAFTGSVGEGETTPSASGGDDDHGVANNNHNAADSNNIPTLFRTFSSVEAELYFHRQRRVLNGLTPPPLAYLIIISNEDFVDGALVLGRSLRLNSPFLREAKADMCLIVPRGRISAESQVRLYRDGFFDNIIEVTPLAEMAPKAFWKDTFDKIYMFNMTWYDKVVFMDADMVCVRRDMDELFEDKYANIAKDGSSVAAIGDKHGFGGSKGSYFQTGMMVIRPNKSVFDGIYKLFEEGVPPKGVVYSKGMHGRDGVLLRDYFKESFQPLDNKYSRNLNPRWRIPQGVISLHLRGKHKPWFNKVLPNADPELGKKEFGFPYLEWWRLYEDHIHVQSEAFAAALYFELYSVNTAPDNSVVVTANNVSVEELVSRHGVSSLMEGSALPVKALDKKDDLSEAYNNGPHIAIRAAVLDLIHTLQENAQLVTNELRERWRRILAEYGTGASESEDDVQEEGVAASSTINRGKTTSASGKLSPLTHVWMMRGNPKKAYTQHLLAIDRRRRMSLEGLLPDKHGKGKKSRTHQEEIAARNMYVVPGRPGMSCESVCMDPAQNADVSIARPEHHELPIWASSHTIGDNQEAAVTTLKNLKALPPALSCSVPHLKYGAFQSCAVLRRLLGCSRCESGIYWRPHPGNDYPSRLHPDLLKEAKKPPKKAPQASPLAEVCYYNFLHDERSVPNCTAAIEGVARLCPCVGSTL